MRNVVKITECDLHAIVEDAANRILREYCGQDKKDAKKRGIKSANAVKNGDSETYNKNVIHLTNSKHAGRKLNSFQKSFEKGIREEEEDFNEQPANNLVGENQMKLNENKQYNDINRKIVRLTESDLRSIVKEAVNRIINEEGGFGDGATNASYGRDLMWQKNPTLYNDGSQSKRVGNMMKITRNGDTSYLANGQTPQSFKPVEESVNEADPGIDKYDFIRQYNRNKQNGTRWIDLVTNVLERFGLHLLHNYGGSIEASIDKDVDIRNIIRKLLDELSVCGNDGIYREYTYKLYNNNTIEIIETNRYLMK